jgi:hypothetical protein
LNPYGFIDWNLKRGLVAHYRYSTAALIGPWRTSPGQALDDAIRAGQARYDLTGKQIELLVGRIEEKTQNAA